jgi:hypothetical protein
MKENLFTNHKETKRAIKAAVDQFRKVLKKDEICRNNTSVKHKWGRKNRA